MKLRCDKIIVTGGGSGIGAAIAQRLIDAGAHVVIAGRTAEKLQSTAEAIASERLHIRQNAIVIECEGCACISLLTKK